MVGLKDIYALSLRPDAAIKMAIGDLTIQFATENLEYKGKLVITLVLMHPGKKKTSA